MIIAQNFESSILAAHNPNYIVIDDVQGNLTLDWVFTLANPLSGTLVYAPKNNRVEINILEITKLIYGNLIDYNDPYDYSGNIIYNETDNYHYGKLALIINDTEEGLPTISLTIINAALQVKECVIMAQYINKELGSLKQVNSEEEDTLLSFDLNQNLA